MVPGEINNRERSIAHNSEDLVEAVEAWAIRLQEELEVIPERRELAIQWEQLEELFKTVSGMPDDYFSREEDEAFAARLTDLEDKIKRSLTESIQPQEELSQKLGRIQEDFESLKKAYR